MVTILESGNCLIVPTLYHHFSWHHIFFREKGVLIIGVSKICLKKVLIS